MPPDSLHQGAIRVTLMGIQIPQQLQHGAIVASQRYMITKHSAWIAQRSRPVVLSALLAACPVVSQAQAPERLSDREVKALIEQVYDARDKFEGNLDDSVKESVMKTPTTDARALAVLQDLQDNASKLKDRFNAEYAAGAEAETLLKQANTINAAMERANVTKGRSQWDKLAATLKRLAAVYGTTFPLPDGAAVRRINDGETAAAAGAAASAADDIQKQIGKDKTVPKSDKEAVKRTAKDLSSAANALKSRIKDGKLATGEARQVIELASKLDALTKPHGVVAVAPPASGLRAATAKLQQSFMMPARPAT